MGTTRWAGGTVDLVTDLTVATRTFQRETIPAGGGRVRTAPGFVMMPSTAYCLTAWIRGSAGTCPFLGTESPVNEHWLIGDGVVTDNYGGTSTAVISDGRWRWYARPFTTLANEYSVVIESELWGGCGMGTADFDDIALHVGACPAGPNLTQGVAVFCPQPTTENTCAAGCTADGQCDAGSWCNDLLDAGRCEAKVADGLSVPGGMCVVSLAQRACVSSFCGPVTHTCGPECSVGADCMDPARPGCDPATRQCRNCSPIDLQGRCVSSDGGTAGGAGGGGGTAGGGAAGGATAGGATAGGATAGGATAGGATAGGATAGGATAGGATAGGPTAGGPTAGGASAGGGRDKEVVLPGCGCHAAPELLFAATVLLLVLRRRRATAPARAE